LTAPVLQIRNATLGFQEKTLWSNLNLDVQPREFIAVIGANGSGKTSLLKAILGEMKLTSGEIRIDQKLVRRGNHHVG
jgi:zinc/manganese transport system ATP-binding protein